MPHADNLHALQIVFLFLLAVVAVIAALAQRFKLPSSILLVLAGLGISFVPHLPQVRLNPDLVFLIFLPPLLYAGAWQTNWREFRRNLVSISMLAIGLVAFTVLGVALVADRFSSWAGPACAGSLRSPPLSACRRSWAAASHLRSATSSSSSPSP